MCHLRLRISSGTEFEGSSGSPRWWWWLLRRGASLCYSMMDSAVRLLPRGSRAARQQAHRERVSESPPRPHMSYGARSWTFNTDAAAAVAVLHPGTGLRLQADSGSSRALHKGSTLIKWHWALLSFFILKGPPCWPISAATADMFRAPLASPAINPPSPAESPGPMERWRMINYSSC